MTKIHKVWMDFYAAQFYFYSAFKLHCASVVVEWELIMFSIEWILFLYIITYM